MLKNKWKKFNENKTYSGENPFRCTTQDERDLVLAIVLFLLYILIPIKNNESKVVKYFKRAIFFTTTILDSIALINKCVFTQ